MRIRILSDLHLEFGPFKPPPVDADLVVLAGDIHKGANGVRWANERFSVPVIYVLGNHEFYGKEIHHTLTKCREAAAPHVHVLDRDAVEVGGYRFLGVTLWTDFDLFDEIRRMPVFEACQSGMNDFKVIRYNTNNTYRRFSPPAARALHRRGREWLEQQLAAGDSPRTVVVTHHAPHRGSLAPEFAHDLVSAAYVSDLSALMGSVTLWIHGHTHTSFDYLVDGTRVVCNPRGYAPNDLNPGFDPELVVEVPS